MSFILCLPRHSVQTCGQIYRRVAPRPNAETAEPNQRGEGDEADVVGRKYLSGHPRDDDRMRDQLGQFRLIFYVDQSMLTLLILLILLIGVVVRALDTRR